MILGTQDNWYLPGSGPPRRGPISAECMWPVTNNIDGARSDHITSPAFDERRRMATVFPAMAFDVAGLEGVWLSSDVAP